MATPHVAGAAALLRQRYPTADPQWIKNALMEKAVDLGLNAFAQGSGRINVYGSATLVAYASSSAVNFGVDDKSQPSFAKSQSITLTNKSTGSKTYSLSISGSLPTGITLHVTPSTLTLAAGEMRSFVFDVSVDNSIAPDSATTTDPSQPYDFEGRILATAGTDTVRMPFVFFKAPQLTVHFDSPPWFLILHPYKGGPAKMIQPSSDYTTLVPVGSYSVITFLVAKQIRHG